MKFPKSTLILLISAVFLGGIVYLFETEGRPQLEAAKNQENLVFDFQEKDVQTVVLKTQNKTIQFDRNQPQQNNISATKWRMKILEIAKETETKQESEAKENTESGDNKTTALPENSTVNSSGDKKASERDRDTQVTPSPEAKATERPKEKIGTQMPANDAYVAYLLDKLVKAKSERIPSDPRIDYGLNEPLATVDIKLNNQVNHQLILGKPNFNDTSLYAIADPPKQVKEPIQVLLVTKDFEYAVNRPLSEWKQEESQK